MEVSWMVFLSRQGMASIGVKWLPSGNLYAEPSHFSAGSMSEMHQRVWVATASKMTFPLYGKVGKISTAIFLLIRKII